MSASFDSYKIFYFVGKYKNITHAAGALFLSQSTVSRAMQSLESDLGCKLMERSQQGIFLTAEGEMLSGMLPELMKKLQSEKTESKDSSPLKLSASVSEPIILCFAAIFSLFLKTFKRIFPMCVWKFPQI